MMEEVWKPIEGTDGGYEVSNLGRVMSKMQRNPRIMPQTIQRSGYHYVMLHVNNKPTCRRVHRLVAQAFLPNPANMKEVNHKDGNKDNNRADNLEWCTRSHNVKHSFDMGLKQPHRWTAEERKQIADKVKDTIKRKNKQN